MVDCGMKWQIKVREDFAAAHALRHYKGKCENMHGHNFKVEVCLEGNAIDAKTGMLLDFTIVKAQLRKIMAQLDHKNLNDLPYFAETSPSSENIALYVSRELQSFFEADYPEVNLVSVGVSEKESQEAVYFPD